MSNLHSPTYENIHMSSPGSSLSPELYSSASKSDQSNIGQKYWGDF